MLRCIHVNNEEEIYWFEDWQVHFLLNGWCFRVLLNCDWLPIYFITYIHSYNKQSIAEMPTENEVLMSAWRPRAGASPDPPHPGAGCALIRKMRVEKQVVYTSGEGGWSSQRALGSRWWAVQRFSSIGFGRILWYAPQLGLTLWHWVVTSRQAHAWVASRNLRAHVAPSSVIWGPPTHHSPTSHPQSCLPVWQLQIPALLLRAPEWSSLIKECPVFKK